MLIFAGLGNPGAQYANNRHNVGFMAADAIHRRHGFSPWARKFQGLIADGTIDGEKVLLIKPQTYMNLSGQAVGEAMRFYKLQPAALTVFYDELDLVAGKVRVKTAGGAGGHNGIKSLDTHIGKEYRRVRIGIGHPGVRELVHGHVLGDFAKADAEWVDSLLDAIAANAAYLVKGDDNGFMNRLSLAVPGAAPAPAAKGPRAADAADEDSGTGAEKPARGRSHIRQARPQQPAMSIPETGPMAAMLKKIFGKQ